MKQQNLLTKMLLLFALIVGSVTSVWAENVTWDLTTSSYSSASTDEVTWVSTYVNFTATKNSSGTNVNNYLGGTNNQTRFYNGNLLTFTPTNAEINSIVITVASTSGGASNITGGTLNNCTASASGQNVTITPTSGNSSCSVQLKGNIRVLTIQVSYTVANLTYWIVTYKYNDGSTADKVVNVNKGDDAAAYSLEAAPSRENMTFLGWNDGTNTYNGGDDYALTNNVTFTAMWEYSGPSTTYVKSSQNDLATGAQYVLIGNKSGVNHFAVPSELGSKHQYFDSNAPTNAFSEITDTRALFVDETPLVLTLEETEDGWYLKNSEGDKLGMSGDKQMSWNDGDLTWVLGKTDDGTPTFTATYSSSNYTLYYNSSATRFNGYTSKGSNVYAYYYRLDNGKIIYTLTLNFNDGKTENGSHRVLEGATYTLTNPTREGYIFTGWNTSEDGTGTNYEAGEFTMPSEATTLYAQWSNDISLTPTKTYTTLTSAYNLDFTGLSLKAYIVKDEDLSDGKVTMTQINKVPAGTGLVIKAENPGIAVEVPFFEGDADDVTGNKMQGSATETTAIAANGGWILSNGAFHPSNGEGVLAAGKAYLAISVPTTGAPALSMDFGGETTGIESHISASPHNEGACYDLSGRRIALPTKGVFIVNGKKVLVK